MVFDNVLCSCFESWFCLCHCLCPPWLSLGLDFVPLTPHLSSVSHGQWGQRNNLSHSLFCSLLRHVINNTGKRRGGPEIIALPYRAKRRQIYIWFRRKLHFTATFNVGPSFIFLSQTQVGLLPAILRQKCHKAESRICPNFLKVRIKWQSHIMGCPQQPHNSQNI